MPTRVFKTLADELLVVADQAAEDFEVRGYKVHTERAELGYPFTPALVCTRGRITTIIVEVDAGNRFGKLSEET
jgi:hypothetical protein